MTRAVLSRFVLHVILFAIYAVLVWHLAMRYRRRWQGYAIVLIGAGLSYGAAHTLMLFDTFLSGGPRLVQHLIWGETALVLVIGLFVASLPRPPKGSHCAYCWYDLSGHDDAARGGCICPECGVPAGGWPNKSGGKRTRAVAQVPEQSPPAV